MVEESIANLPAAEADVVESEVQIADEKRFLKRIDNYIKDYAIWIKGGMVDYEPLRIDYGLFAKGGVADKPSIFGEAGAEAAFTASQVKGMYDFIVKSTTAPTAGGGPAFGLIINGYCGGPPESVVVLI